MRYFGITRYYQSMIALRFWSRISGNPGSNLHCRNVIDMSSYNKHLSKKFQRLYMLSSTSGVTSWFQLMALLPIQFKNIRKEGMANEAYEKWKEKVWPQEFQFSWIIPYGLSKTIPRHHPLQAVSRDNFGDNLCYYNFDNLMRYNIIFI